MSSDIKMWDEEIIEALDWLEDTLGGMNKVKESDRGKKLDQCDAKVAEVKSLIKSFNIELRHVTEPALLKEYKDKKTDYTERLTGAGVKIKFFRGTDDRGALMEGGGPKKEKDFNKQTGEELIHGALKTQDDTKAALDRIKNAVSDSKEIGMAVGTELIRQTEQMQTIGESLDEIDGELDRSNKLIRAFGIRMATDRCIQIFMFLLVAGLVVIICLATFLPKTAGKSFSVPDVVKPPVSDITNAVNGGKRLLRYLR